MTPIMQTRYGPRGNCLAACIASLIDRPLEEVDFSCADHPDDWDDVAREKLAPHGLTFAHIRANMREHLLTFGPVLYIAHGFTNRPGMLQHAVIMQGRELIHDPHPGGSGILYVREASFITPLNFARPTPCRSMMRT